MQYPTTQDSTITDEASQPDVSKPEDALDEVHETIWKAVRHLFPRHAVVRQTKPGWLSITWPIRNHPDAQVRLATPIVVHLEKELLDLMWTFSNRESRQRIARQQEGHVRSGMRGFCAC